MSSSRCLCRIASRRAIHPLSRPNAVHPDRAAPSTSRCSSTVSAVPPPSSRSYTRLGAVATLAVATIGFYYYSSLRTAEQLRLEGILTPLTFAPLTIKRIKRLTDETLQFTFAIPPSQLPPSDSTSLPLPSMPIKSVYLLQPELAIQRPYTPLSALSFLSAEEGGTGELDLVIKRYPDGEVSRWMHRLRVGDQVKMRGPTVTWTFDESKYDEIVFIVGGTGVTPAYQMIEHVLASNTATPQKLTIIYASPSPSTILIKPELDSLLQRASTKGGPALEIKYLVSKDGDGQTGSPSGWFGSSTAGDKEIVDRLRKEGIELGRLGRKNLASWIGENSIDASTVAASRKVILVCGPEGMVNAIAGPRARDQSQGEVGGVLAELGYTTSQVVKL